MTLRLRTERGFGETVLQTLDPGRGRALRQGILLSAKKSPAPRISTKGIGLPALTTTRSLGNPNRRYSNSHSWVDFRGASVSTIRSSSIQAD
jgi:hypothetical protein